MQAISSISVAEILEFIQSFWGYLIAPASLLTLISFWRKWPRLGVASATMAIALAGLALIPRADDGLGASQDDRRVVECGRLWSLINTQLQRLDLTETQISVGLITQQLLNEGRHVTSTEIVTGDSSKFSVRCQMLQPWTVIDGIRFIILGNGNCPVGEGIITQVFADEFVISITEWSFSLSPDRLIRRGGFLLIPWHSEAVTSCHIQLLQVLLQLQKLCSDCTGNCYET